MFYLGTLNNEGKPNSKLFYRFVYVLFENMFWIKSKALIIQYSVSTLDFRNIMRNTHYKYINFKLYSTNDMSKMWFQCSLYVV